MLENVLNKAPIPRIPLMEGSRANPSVVKEMKNWDYRLEILKQMVEQRFLTAKIDVSDKTQLNKLDSQIISLIQDGFGAEVISNDKAYQLYLELCFNQSLLDKALNIMSARKPKLQ